MSLEYYLNRILESDSAAELYSIATDARADGTLRDTQIAIIQSKINSRFSQLNALAVGPQKGRWS